ncbi:glutamine--fructose-6-phosphate transaminase (isomerizing) [Halovivax limisalsi]|uniref:glutamine--fructose-6-phosphate transaminase (isomerizing) n=1 Tax=Halovivax limisalsi TaxID=1453760 RepID=UPI001FFD59D1|nr:glutamine--fructose-6-phosphate transaminase (isomerizing) [Halovivax limisalsi]
MCGIIGYTGDGDHVMDVLLTGLSGLEYRGYDSAGVAISEPERTAETEPASSRAGVASTPAEPSAVAGDVTVHKREGELAALEDALPDGSVDGAAGIGHTRWSTHGPPSDANAHPHTDCSGHVAVVHNGIIENYEELREELAADGHAFESDTDTEVVPHLLERELARGADPEAAFRTAVSRLAGSYAVAAVVAGDETVYAARHESPLVLGVGGDGHFLASDVPAFIEYTDRVIYLDDGEFATVTPTGVRIADERGNTLETSVETISWDPEDAGKSGYDHYMLKEINEQPEAIRDCLRERVEELSGSVSVSELDDVSLVRGSATDGDSTGRLRPVQFVACGTSYHAALYGARLLRERGVPAQSFLASEYTTDRVPVSAETVAVGVTQSGETADTLRALREANRAGAETIALTNVVGSSAARECDHVTYVRAGPEIGVAATKTFASQQVALAMLAAALTDGGSQALVESLRAIPDGIQRVLDETNARAVAREFVDSDAFFFIGRGYDAPVAMEGALKMKEITYRHAEGFAAGELKHGPLALVTEETPVFATMTDSQSGGDGLSKILGNVREVEARGAPVVAVTDQPEAVGGSADHVLEVPSVGPAFTPILANVQLQLVSYWVANELGRSIDKPRNLAKSVTVE